MNANIIRTARTIINAADLDAAKDFYVNALGFIETENDGEHLYLRGLEEYHHHSLVLKKSAQTGVQALGFKVWSKADLETLADYFENIKCPVKWFDKGDQYALGEAIRVMDPHGLPLEFYYEMETVESCLRRYDQYKGAKVQRIDHFNCMVPDVESVHRFFINELGFRCSEYTVTKDNKMWASWMYRKPTVHDLALTNGHGPRLHHFAYFLSEPNSILNICDILASLGYSSSIERGPGRHGVSNAFFLYLKDPDGNRIELYTGDYFTGDPDFKPLKWDFDDPQRQTLWGHPAPDSWFEEASPFLNVYTGEPVDTKDSVGVQKKPNYAKS
ncbi:catechol 2,3-dioxygenase [Scopulibacillus daqui]|uniref:Catechol 2,3-dioxygenase n=1 Tax=Scopulibacillus daqui TaxID=1469162 RepID=A0ABS2Q2N9_9BACL|nr:3,4-dihydroxyphenylacetate 2,3-dioxygenase [Scopulibacillus daqui]MBM7646558.1 catechol 2,3-dioxygenase [Scopulibacillus daqui]